LLQSPIKCLEMKNLKYLTKNSTTILSNLPSETLVQNTLNSIPPCYTNHINKEYNMKSMEPKILNYTYLY